MVQRDGLGMVYDWNGSRFCFEKGVFWYGGFFVDAQLLAESTLLADEPDVTPRPEPDPSDAVSVSWANPENNVEQNKINAHFSKAVDVILQSAPGPDEYLKLHLSTVELVDAL